MSNSFLIFSSVLFAAFLGLSFIQVTKIYDPEHHGDHHGKVVYGFPVPETVSADAEEEFMTPIAVRLAGANPALGPNHAAKCTTCHAFEQGGAAKLGPALWGIVGRDIASAEGFAYSCSEKSQPSCAFLQDAAGGFGYGGLPASALKKDEDAQEARRGSG